MTDSYFLNLEKINEIMSYTIPQCVSATKNPKDQTQEQIINIQSKFLNLGEAIKDKLSSDETGEQIQQIGKLYHLQLLQLADISRAIRSYYFGELKLEDFPANLAREMNIEINVAKEISQIVASKIIMDNSAEKAYQSRMDHLSILDAMKKYPEISEQLITSEQIQIKHFQGLVRPSVKNWISDYTANLGYESHNTTVRGNYLFQTENTKNLSYQDRQKLSQILKSFDEKTPLEIDTITKKIIFSQPIPERKPTPAPANIPTPSQYPTHPAENARPAYDASPIKQKPIEASAKADYDMPANYQPRTQEPGNDFEKVIQFEEKKKEDPFLGSQRVVNLREPEKERPTLPKPPVKNLLNIKELIEVSKDERQNIAPKPYSAPKTEEIPPMPKKEEQAIFPDRFNLQKITKNTAPNPQKPLSAINNSVNHDYFTSSNKTAWTNSTGSPLDETEKKLFESNNKAVLGEGQKNPPAGTVSGIAIKDFSQNQKKDNFNIQFSSSQKLPYEKEQEEIEKKPIVSQNPQISQEPKIQPYRIHPTSFEDN